MGSTLARPDRYLLAGARFLQHLDDLETAPALRPVERVGAVLPLRVDVRSAVDEHPDDGAAALARREDECPLAVLVGRVRVDALPVPVRSTRAFEVTTPYSIEGRRLAIILLKVGDRKEVYR